MGNLQMCETWINVKDVDDKGSQCQYMDDRFTNSCKTIDYTVETY